MEYSVNLNRFQGPFELLFHLIENREIDIYDIPIAEITEQYLFYLEQMRQFNMNVTSEFILMAATLIEIKSQMLLPQKNKEEDPRLELVNKLLEYKMFKDVTVHLKEYESESSFYYSKPREEIMFSAENKVEQLKMSEVSIFELYNIFVDLMKKQNVKTEQPTKYKMYKDVHSVKQCFDWLFEKLQKFGSVSLFDAIKNSDIKITKEYVVTMFLAVLELSKINKIKIAQNNIFGDISVVYSQNGD